MSSEHTGTVKWIDHDGTGYVTIDGHPGTSYLFDISTAHGAVMNKQAVTFTIETILGRECAFNVTAK